MSPAVTAFVASAAAAGVLGGGPGPARAQGANSLEAVNKVLQMNRQAMDLFGDREFQLARETLQEALRTAESSRLGGHFAAAITHGNLGIVAAAGYKDRAVAVKQFRAALAIKPDYELPPDVNDGETKAALAAARGRGVADGRIASAAVPGVEDLPGSPAAPAAAGDGTAGPRVQNSKALRCPTGGEVLAGDDVALHCVAAPELRPASVVLFYKRLGDDEFTPVPMQPQPSPGGVRSSTWSGSIPGGDVRGSWVPFYFEAHDASGQPIALSGRYDSPNLLTIKSIGLDLNMIDQTHAGGAVDENPLAKKAVVAGEVAARATRLFVGLAVGSGFGYAAGPGIEAWRQYQQSFHPALAGYGLGQVLPEFGYFVNPTFAVAIGGRFQYIPPVERDKGRSARGAVSALARALFFSGTGEARFYGSLALGGGEGFRMVMDVRPVDAAGNPVYDTSGKVIPVVRDTVRGGPAVAGGGVGFCYDIGPAWTWMVESNALFGFPDFSIGLDMNTGLRARF